MELDNEVYLLEREDDLSRFNSLIEAITKITPIQVLRLKMPLDARWYRHFHRLINLKELKWGLEELLCLNLRKELLEVIEERNFPDHDHRYDENYLAKKIFLQSFAGSAHLPKIDFNIWYDWKRDQDLMDNPPEDHPVDLGHNRAWGGYSIYDDEDYWNHSFGLEGGNQWNEDDWEDEDSELEDYYIF